MKVTMDPHQVPAAFILCTITVFNTIIVPALYEEERINTSPVSSGVKVLWTQARTKQNLIVFYAFVERS